jgi:hypothetical protein
MSCSWLHWAKAKIEHTLSRRRRDWDEHSFDWSARGLLISVRIDQQGANHGTVIERDHSHDERDGAILIGMHVNVYCSPQCAAPAQFHWLQKPAASSALLAAEGLHRKEYVATFTASAEKYGHTVWALGVQRGLQQRRRIEHRVRDLFVDEQTNTS